MTLKTTQPGLPQVQNIRTSTMEKRQREEKPAGKSRRALWSGRVDLNHRPQRPEGSDRSANQLALIGTITISTESTDATEDAVAGNCGPSSDLKL